MKKSGIITLALAGLMMVFTACQQDSDEIGSSIDNLELEADLALETTYEEVDQLVELEFANFEEIRFDGQHRPECATVTHVEETDVDPGTITIDFGDGSTPDFQGIVYLDQ